MSVIAERRVLTVRLFARFAEVLGSEISVPAEEITTVGDLLTWIRRLPNGARVADSALVAVNLTQARSDVRLAPGDEIALLPPLAGG
ncbi:MAG: MoaD/ThiS family protein [Gemmatimonadales bacterium]